MTHNDGVKLEMNSQGMVGNSLNLKSKLNAPMNTIMPMALVQAAIKDFLQVQVVAGRKLNNMAVVKEYLTTEAERIVAEREDMKELERASKKRAGEKDE